jgi:hypothetical protein
MSLTSIQRKHPLSPSTQQDPNPQTPFPNGLVCRTFFLLYLLRGWRRCLPLLFPLPNQVCFLGCSYPRIPLAQYYNWTATPILPVTWLPFNLPSRWMSVFCTASADNGSFWGVACTLAACYRQRTFFFCHCPICHKKTQTKNCRWR